MKKVALLGLALLILALAGLAGLALQRGPSLPPTPPAADAAVAHQVRGLWRALRPGATAPGALRQLRLGEAELNALAGQALLAQGGNARARFAIEPEQVQLRLALPAPHLPAWLNLQLRWDLREPQPGRLPPLTAARVGDLPLPAAWVERWLLAQAAERSGLNLAALPPLLEGWRAQSGQLWLLWRWHPGPARRLVAPQWTEAERAALLALAAPLATSAAQAGPVQPLGPHLQRLARQAVAEGHEPAAALKAVLVLASLQVLGRDLAPWLPEARELGRLPPAPLQLAGREDMAQHFLLAALIAWQGGERSAEVLGLAKEVADSRGSSGFSFNDLAADAAGTRFGRLAATTPGPLLQRLADGMPERDFFPEVADLPEFLGEAAFRQRYGQLGSPAYEAELARIRARIDALPLHQGNTGP